MPTHSKSMRPPRPGDRIVIRAHRQGQPARVGEIVEVLGGARLRYRVRWLDGDRESVVYPGEDVSVERRPAGPLVNRAPG
jgi:Domain of unknown function (DUF1918)